MGFFGVLEVILAVIGVAALVFVAGYYALKRFFQ